MHRILQLCFGVVLAAGCAKAQSASVPAPGASPAPAAATAPAAAKPSLVVMITIDGFREGNLEKFGPQLRGGLARLTSGGAWFTGAQQDHAITETAPGHASLLSGRFPRSTGIAANRLGVIDEASPLLGFSGVVGASPRRFHGTTLVDWIRARDSRSRALSASMKDRGAILPVGTSKQEVYWYPGDGEFTTSRYYADSLPDWVMKFNARNLPMTYAGKSWTPLLPDSAYQERDSVAVEGGGTDVVFPHLLPPDSMAAASLIRTMPFIDDVTVAFALAGVEALHLGQGPGTDVLAVSLSANDLINHRYGPDSKEAHDEVLRVDRTIGVLLDSLFKLRDPSRVVVVLTADHGFATIPELDPPTMTPRPMRVTLLPALEFIHDRLKALQVDTMAVEVDQQVVLIDRAAFAKAHVKADSVLTLFQQAAKQIPGVFRIDRFKDLLKGDTINDPITRRWVHQIPPDYPVELVATLTKGSIWAGLVTTHGSPYDYDSNVPIIFYGPGFAPGRYNEFVRTVDIAPTLAQLLGVKPLEKLDGVVLRRALK